MGDQNTSFFHKTVKKRQSKNKIVSLIRRDGRRVDDPNGVKNEVISYHESLLDANSSLPYPGKERLEMVIRKKLTDLQKSEMTMEISLEEIEATFLSLHANRAPGPDGFNSFFFKRAWNIIGKDISKAI